MQQSISVTRNVWNTTESWEHTWLPIFSSDKIEVKDLRMQQKTGSYLYLASQGSVYPVGHGAEFHTWSKFNVIKCHVGFWNIVVQDIYMYKDASGAR